MNFNLKQNETLLLMLNIIISKNTAYMLSTTFQQQQKPVYTFKTEIDQLPDDSLEPISNQSVEQTFEYDDYSNKNFYCNEPNNSVYRKCNQFTST